MIRFTEPVLDPTAAAALPRDTVLAPRPGTLAGARLALVSNGKPNATQLLSELGERLQRSHGVQEVRAFRKGYFGTPVEDELADEIAEACDVAAAAIGD